MKKLLLFAFILISTLTVFVDKKNDNVVEQKTALEVTCGIEDIGPVPHPPVKITMM